jgi:hypothetical protein
MRIDQRRSIHVRSVFIMKNIVIANISQTHHLDDQRRGKVITPKEEGGECKDGRLGHAAAQKLSASFDFS